MPGTQLFLLQPIMEEVKKRPTGIIMVFFVPGSSQTWFALLGNAVVPLGELKTQTQVYQKELNELIRELLAKQ